MSSNTTTVEPSAASRSSSAGPDPRARPRFRSLDDLVIPDSGETARSRGLAGLPDRIVLVIIVAFVSAAACTVFSIMFWWVFVPVFAVLLAASWRFMPVAVIRSKSSTIGSLIAVGLSAVWLLVQAPFASQYLVAIRDPGIYATLGAVVAQTGRTSIGIRGAHALATAVPGLSERLDAFASANNTDIQLQGSSGLPASLAVGYWLGGVNGEILVNLVIGACGLLALYGLSRRILGAYWGLLPALILGASMPYVYLSRTTYSEMMATLLIVASATWGLSAFQTRRQADFVISGVFAGAAALTRVDGALSFAGALLGLILILVGVGRTTSDDRLRRNVLGFAAGGWALLLLGMYDLFVNEPRYLHDLGVLPKELWLGSAALTAVLVVLAVTSPGVRGIQLGKSARIVATVVSFGLGGLFLFWLSRPFWLIYHSTTGAAYQQEIQDLQAQDGLPIQPTRSYDEYSLWWFGWGFGWVFVAAAGVGLCLWLFWAISRRKPGHVLILSVTALVTLLYIDSVKVTPDMIWAFRRVIPAISTAFAVAAAMQLRWLWRRRRWARALAIIGLVGCLVGVALPWGRIFFTVEGSGQAAEISAICHSVGDAKTIAYVEDGAPPNYSLTVRAYCNAQVVTVTDVSTFDWKKLAEAAKGKVAVITFASGSIPWVANPAHPTHTTVVHMWARHLLEMPRTTSITVRSVWVGDLTPGGRIEFVKP